ncbi:Ubiquitin-conjugating enzyme E2 J1, partial [Acanthisitta chloris]
VRTALLAIIGFMPTKGEGAIGSLDYTPEERRALAKKSQDFCCEMCGTSMKTALLPLTSGSVSSQADKEAKELARQISFKNVKKPQNTEEKLGKHRNIHPFRKPSPVLLGKPLLLSRVTSWLSATPARAGESSAVAGQERTPAVSSSSSLSPRQRRAQQQSQRRAPSSADFNRAQQPRVNTNHTGSTVLIVLLTFALAALIFRRICLANEYIFD